ncbi:hypothetical protein QE363_001199 [Sphingomonas sp. SORGH_AS870]|uniref:hypothetical protein n=1 Tax=Sphingomonas sp. SORGH_AS_0870 TaxID=3041801 RepID=UPI0028673FBD|nr:hypothetical protein [Sphingomonas sp. SORGH_AS_0870]MDR6145406.1 hypothetical protein [Sphingomonas sp. SORGH_AS_0870]
MIDQHEGRVDIHNLSARSQGRDSEDGSHLSKKTDEVVRDNGRMKPRMALLVILFIAILSWSWIFLLF